MFSKKNSIILSQRLKELRYEKGLSHEKLELELRKHGINNISLQSLKDYEAAAKGAHSKFNSSKGMSAEKLFNLASFYGVSVDYLLGRTENRTTTEDDKTTLATTGLTEKALDNIKVLCHKSKHTIASNLPERTVSFFLESDSLIEIVRCLALAEIHFDILDPSPSIIKARAIQQLDDDKPSKSQKTLDEYSKLAVSALCSEGYSPLVELKLHEAVSKLLYSFKEELEHGKHK